MTYRDAADMLTQAPTYGWSDDMVTALIMAREALRELDAIHAHLYGDEPVLDLRQSTS